MSEQGIKDASVFKTWLQEEQDYLKGLSTEPIEEMLQIDYYQKLVNLKNCEYVISFISRWSL